MDVSFAGGMHTLKIGSNGIGPALAQGTTIVPGNATLAQTMSVTLADGSSLSMPITVGASASSALPTPQSPPAAMQGLPPLGDW